MRAVTFIALCTIALGGCVTHQTYGNFVGSAAIDQRQLAADAVKQVVSLLPPAKTHLALPQAPSDPFGLALANSLREEGYALEERGEGASVGDSSALEVRYVVDRVGGDFYQVTMLVGTQSLSRLYQIQQDSLVPAGSWARKE